MIYSVGCEYVLRALTKMARMGPPGRFFLLRELIEGERIPQHFLGKLFQSLVRDGILISAKGRGGGFSLRRSPAQTTLNQIVMSIDSNSRLGRCLVGFENCNGASTCPPNSPCGALRQQVEEMLENTSLADLVLAYEQRKKNRARRRATH